MKARTVVGIIVGFLSWWALFLLTIVVIALLWPAFAKAGRAASVSNDYSALTTSMLALLLATYVYINGLAGWIAARVAGRRTAMWFAVTPIFAYAAFQHLHTLWHALPTWYNLGVVAFIYPFSWLGASLVRSP
jgi:cbb3-type cytochrome oxidase subunit 3